MCTAKSLITRMQRVHPFIFIRLWLGKTSSRSSLIYSTVLPQGRHKAEETNEILLKSEKVWKKKFETVKFSRNRSFFKSQVHEKNAMNSSMGKFLSRVSVRWVRILMISSTFLTMSQQLLSNFWPNCSFLCRYVGLGREKKGNRIL